jgi:hypothetical protein
LQGIEHTLAEIAGGLEVACNREGVPGVCRDVGVKFHIAGKFVRGIVQALEQQRYHLLVDLCRFGVAEGYRQPGFNAAGDGSLGENGDGGEHRGNCRIVDEFR